MCGAPQSGKSLTANLLSSKHGGFIVDDGEALRRAAMELYDLTMGDVTTQEGKARVVEVCGVSYTVRDLLGRLGNLMESQHGNQFTPQRAISKTVGIVAPFFIFPSCRKDQGKTYLKDGIVIEIQRPGYNPVYDFDVYDKSLVSYTILNDGNVDQLATQTEALASRLQHQ